MIYKFRYLKDKRVSHMFWDSLDEMVKDLFALGMLEEGFSIQEGIDFKRQKLTGGLGWQQKKALEI